MRKLPLMLSLPGSPSPVVGSGFWKISDQPLNVPLPPVVELFWMTSVQVPWAFMPAKADSGNCGLNVAKNGALPFWIGVPALSSKTVLVKLAVLMPWPTLLNRGIDDQRGFRLSRNGRGSPSGRGRWDS